MKKKILLILPIIIIAGLALYFFRYPILATKGVLEIRTNPKAIAFVNGKQIGTTPLKREFSPQNLTVKIFPVQQQASKIPLWQGTVRINPSVLTLIRQDFTNGRGQNTGEILTLNKIPDKSMAALRATSYPNKAAVSLDGKIKGYTPLLLEKIKAGQHTLELSLPHYRTTVLGLNMNAGYRLDCEIKLAPQKEKKKKEESPSAPEENKPRVRILPTPTGWLRVRRGAGTSSPEIAKVKPGNEYPLLDKKNGWFKIQLNDKQEGWISGQYAALSSRK